MTSITDELRLEAQGLMVSFYTSEQTKRLFAIADRIDAIHAALEAENERLKQDVAMYAESEQEKCIAYLRKENIDWEDKYRGIAKENTKLREQIDTLVIYVEADGTKYSVDDDGNQHFDHSNTRTSDGWVELSKDADGEYIHIGDVMEPKGSGLLFGETSFEVRSMRCDECGWGVYDRLGDRYAPSLLRHHNAPTVEDVLREFALKVTGEDCMTTRTGFVEEYAEKVREVMA